MTTQLGTNEYIVMNAVFAKIDKVAFTLAAALIFFLGMFTVTGFLILNGATATDPAGLNPLSLSYYLPGYTLSWGGNIIGSIYLGIIGAIIGYIFALLWNLTHYLYLAILLNRFHILEDL